MNRVLLVETSSQNNQAIWTVRVADGTLRVGDFLSLEDEPQNNNRIKVDRIFAYGHDLDELPEGMTADLTLVGSPADKVEKNSLWLASNPHPVDRAE